MAHCWKDQAEHLEETGDTDAAWELRLSGGSGTCMLPDGHDGPHVFTPDDEIVVEFKGQPT